MPVEDKIRELERKLEELERYNAALLELLKKSGVLAGQIPELEKQLHQKGSQIKQTGDKAWHETETLRKIIRGIK